MAWFSELQQASFRGIPFGVLIGRGRVGRRLALHEYPFRDKPWAEDVGRKTRRFNLIGFLVEDDLISGGGSVIQQRDRMIAAAETKDSGTLVHPTLGEMTVSLEDLGCTEKWDEGRYFELELDFVESGEREFPAQDSATADQLVLAAFAADAASETDFMTRVADDIIQGAAVGFQIVGNAIAWGSRVLSIVSDATMLVNLVASLPGSFGRYFGGRNYGGFTGLSPLTKPQLPGGPTANPPATTASLIAAGSASRAAVAASVATLNAAAANIIAAGEGPQAFAAAAQGVAASVLAAAADPADGVRLLAGLADFTPPVLPALDPIGAAMADAQDATGDLFRRATVVSMARASASYQPASHDDAFALMDRVTALLDLEITIAGDQGEDGSYNALNALRLAVVRDLTARGASLAPIASFMTAVPLPAMALALRFYRDAGRADQLVKQVDPIHPAFMPVSFKALAS
jgi:prophage DNA circulation protein